jgi:catechol 2,3-dioxygenase-like lactoylglutathione lyase family enzyme
MTIRLDHTIVPAKDKVASAKFFAEIFGLTLSSTGHFAPVQINESLTFDFADEPESSGARRQGSGHHYAFHVSEDEFDAIFNLVWSKNSTERLFDSVQLERFVVQIKNHRVQMAFKPFLK